MPDSAEVLIEARGPTQWITIDGLARHNTINPGILAGIVEQLRPRWPKLADLMNASEYDVLAYMSFLRQHRFKLHSTNPIERLNASSRDARRG